MGVDRGENSLVERREVKEREREDGNVGGRGGDAFFKGLQVFYFSSRKTFQRAAAAAVFRTALTAFDF